MKMKALLIVAHHTEGWDIDNLRKGNAELKRCLDLVEKAVRDFGIKYSYNDPPQPKRLRTSTNKITSCEIQGEATKETGHRALATVVHNVEGCEVSLLRKEREHLLLRVEEQKKLFWRMCNYKIHSLNEHRAENDAWLTRIDRQHAQNNEDLARLEGRQEKNEEKIQANNVFMLELEERRRLMRRNDAAQDVTSRYFDEQIEFCGHTRTACEEIRAVLAETRVQFEEKRVILDESISNNEEIRRLLDENIRELETEQKNLDETFAEIMSLP